MHCICKIKTMELNVSLIKSCILLFTPFLSLGFLQNEHYFSAFLCGISFIIMLCNVCQTFDSFDNFDLWEDKANLNYGWFNNVTNNEKNIIQEVSEKCTINKNVITMDTLVETSSSTNIKLKPIAEIVKEELDKKEEKNIILDATKASKPVLDFQNIILQPQTTQTKIDTTNVSAEAILIKNESVVVNERLGVYKTLIEVLQKEELLADKKYALFQSFTFIDVCEQGIVIYIDYGILKKAHLEEKHLHKEDIVVSLRKALHCDNLLVQFVEYKHKSLLNYFLENNK